MPWTRRRRFAVLGTAVACAAVVGMLLWTFVGTWSPLLHITCEDQSAVAHQTDAWIPAVLINSPYGGIGNGTGILDWSFPGAWNGPPPAPGQVLKTGVGSGALNGTSTDALFTVNITLYSVANVTQLGPGTNSPCSAPVRIALQSPGTYGITAAPILTVSNLTDRGEADNVTVFPGLNGQTQSPAFFDNGFTVQTTASISTCSAGEQVLPVATQGLPATFQVNVNNRTYQLPYELPFTEKFTYTFPANFGTWQIDNLSAPGGPGGGWAFNFVGPCT